MFNKFVQRKEICVKSVIKHCVQFRFFFFIQYNKRALAAIYKGLLLLNPISLGVTLAFQTANAYTGEQENSHDLVLIQIDSL